MMRTQNPGQTDLRRLRRLQKTKSKYWKLKKKSSGTLKLVEKKSKEKKEKKEKKKKEPELEVIQDTEIDDGLDDLYSYDEDIDDEENIT